jgi:hypothetical protein
MTTIRETILKGNRRRYKSDYGLNNIYKVYLSLSSNPLNYETFKNIIYEYNEQICKCIIYENLEFHMPNRIGYLRIRKRRTRTHIDEDGKVNTRYMVPNWHATLNLWESDPAAWNKRQIIFHLNRHTRGYVYRWFWDKFTCKVKHQSYYALCMARIHTKELNKAINDTSINIDFYE